MRKKLLMVIGAITGIAIICIILRMEGKSNTTDCIVKEMDNNAIKERMIGAEPPRLLYADHNKVIFENVDIYVYDIENKMLLKSFDVSSLLSEKYKECIYQSKVSSDGNEIFIILKELSGAYTTSFHYSFKTDEWQEISESEYKSKESNAFECTLIDADNELAQITSGYAVYLSESEYFYLTFQDWKVSEINIVYVKNGEKNIYKVFE